jgi:hypothetical protein
MGSLDSLKVAELTDYSLYSLSQALESAMTRFLGIDSWSEDLRCSHTSLVAKAMEVKSEIINRNWGEMFRIALKAEFDLNGADASDFVSFPELDFNPFHSA